MALVLGPLLGSVDAFQIVNRWTETIADGGGIDRGDPITLLWSIVPDGEGYQRASSSNLIGFLDDNWGVATVDRTPDLTRRPWFGPIQDAYEQYSYVSGLTMVYTPEQTAAGIDTGQSGDIRIGGEPFDNNPNVNVLADNVFPNGGDMRIDTTPDPFFSSSNPSGFRNLISHESGHGVGLGHTEPVNAESVMEPGIQSQFFGLQFDDIYAFNRLYGDPREKNGGNDTMATSFDLGAFSSRGSVSLGTDATDSVVEQFDDDWLGIDGASDQDWFRFSIPKAAVVDIRVAPVGPFYVFDGQAFEATRQSDLSFEVYRSDGGLLHTANAVGLGGAEELSNQFLTEPGDYFVRVVGAEDQNQFYQLDLDVALPELLLTVNRDTGEMSISGISSEGVDIDGYRIQSPSGSLNATDGAWQSLEDQGRLSWREANPSSVSVQELLPTGAESISNSESLSLGSFYSQVLTAPFGTPEQGDIAFSYLTPGTGDEWLTGAVQFVGDPFFNTLVLTVDPATGEAVLANEGGVTVSFDGYSIASSSGALSPGDWLSLQDQLLSDWTESNPDQTVLTELKPTGETLLAPGESLSLGALFNTLGEQDLTLSFLLNGDDAFRSGQVSYETLLRPGDYNDDGSIDFEDYFVWAQSFGSTTDLDADGNLDQVVSASDYAVWRASAPPQGSAPAAVEAVPEPSAATLLALAILGCHRSRRRQNSDT